MTAIGDQGGAMPDRLLRSCPGVVDVKINMDPRRSARQPLHPDEVVAVGWQQRRELVVLAAARRQGQPWWTFGVRRGGLKGALIEGFRVVWEWLPLIACVNGLVRLVYEKAPNQVNPVEMILRGDYGVEVQALAAAAAVLRAPIVEELIFRGLFQTWFNTFTAWPGILRASIVFAAVHSAAWPDPSAEPNRG